MPHDWNYSSQLVLVQHLDPLSKQVELVVVKWGVVVGVVVILAFLRFFLRVLFKEVKYLLVFPDLGGIVVCAQIIELVDHVVLLQFLINLVLDLVLPSITI